MISVVNCLKNLWYKFLSTEFVEIRLYNQSKTSTFFVCGVNCSSLWWYALWLPGRPSKFGSLGPKTGSYRPEATCTCQHSWFTTTLHSPVSFCILTYNSSLYIRRISVKITRWIMWFLILTNSHNYLPYPYQIL